MNVYIRFVTSVLYRGLRLVGGWWRFHTFHSRTKSNGTLMIFFFLQVKAVCPLCVTPVTKILHNIRSLSDYDVYNVVPPERDVLASIDDDLDFAIDTTDTDSS